MRAPLARNRSLAAVCSLLLAASLALATPSDPPPAAAEAPESLPAQAAPPDTMPPSLPEPGKVIVEVVDGRVTVLSNEAPRMRVLRSLGRAMGFATAFGELEHDRLTLREEKLELETALARVLEGSPYEIRYEFDPSRHRHVLATVFVGELEESIKEIRRVRTRVRWRQRRQRAASRAALARALADPDPGVRTQVVGRIRLQDPGLRRLGELLARDPAPQVRIAAAGRLGRAGPRAQPLLLLGLRDSDPSVVAAVLEVLALTGDVRALAEIQPLLEHPDPRVRESAARTLRFLE